MVYVPLYIASHLGLYFLFRKANVRNAWLAFIPVVCYWPWIKLAGRPKTWMIWALIPAADVIIWFSLVIDMMESFGKFKFWEQVAGVMVPFIMYPLMAFDKKVVYLGEARDPAFRKKYMPGKKPVGREWADAIFFAFVVAYIIRMFQLEPYKIPTPSMEDSMLVGDFLFVSKMNYGPRFPITPIAFPLVHQDLFGAKAYSDILHLPYMRLPGFQDIKRNDPVVFNVPLDQLDPTPRPVDKMQNYVKRCVGVPGDKLEIKKGVLYINDAVAYQPPKMLRNYYIRFKPNSNVPNDETLTREYDVYDFEQFDEHGFFMALSKEDLEKIKQDFEVDYYQQALAPDSGSHFIVGGREYNAVLKVKSGQQLADNDIRKLGIVYYQPLSTNFENLVVMMNPEYARPEKYAEVPKVDSIKLKWQLRSGGNNAFPDEVDIYPWNKDNYGPVYLPKRGQSVKIDAGNFHFYKRAVMKYEGNENFELNGQTVYLNGKPITEYTFKMDYYWMMGDNRDNSLDSRFWGYVPEDHIVGKPLFVFFSIQYQNVPVGGGVKEQKYVKIRWNRLFKGIN